MDVSWFHLMVLLIVLFVACLIDQHWEYHLDLLILKRLDLIKASYSDLLLVNLYTWSF